ncbi:E3 ubiquitin-protein ligase BOI [Heracleum sosnowskyi]|uniref:E3 ubiquitin-protein ligase BOI n=1 Tax=Heracleum sosnowskyi TaxID=360622 RepID=A0AAD8MK87_9APIA|nr:E3 ubiquitin-protein ligase BOI [Heracleum sosnowskyi]
MAVEARRINMNIFPQQIITNREFVNLNQGNNFDNSFGIMAEDLLPFNQSVIEAKNSMKAESGLTYNNFPSAPRKRSRDSMNELNRVIVPQQHSNIYEFEQNFPIHIQQQQQLEIDQIIAQHSKKIRMEIEERQKQQARILVSAIGERVMKKLREKDEEIHKIAKLNHALQDRVKNLFVENQLWKDLAQSNEATVMSLRCNLEQVLTQVSDDRQFVVPGNLEEAESCCGSSGGDDVEEVNARRRVGNKMCRKCGERESCVLLLPCRHLCLCTVCGTTSQSTCPVCNSSMTATVHVNLSD